MNRTKASTILIVATIGGAAAALVNLALAANGLTILRLEITLAIALAVIGGIVVTLAVPIRRMTRGSGAGPVDPFYALRVVMLAKASALTGALLAGAAIGVLVYLLTRSVVLVGSVSQAIAALVGASVLLAGGLIAEHMCRIPPQDEDDESGDGPVKA